MRLEVWKDYGQINDTLVFGGQARRRFADRKRPANWTPS